MNVGDARLVFKGGSNCLNFFYVSAQGEELRHTWECHDVGVADTHPPDGDAYGHLCKCPPGVGYRIGAPQHLSPPEAAYGFYFTPICDDPSGDLAKHGRAGIGLHGGGSDLPDPLAPRQGWEWTFGCLRLQNEDNAALVESIEYVQSHDGIVLLDVVWP